MVTGVETLDGPLEVMLLGAGKGGKQRVTGGMRKRQILPIQGEVQAQSRKGRARGQDWIPVELQASESNCLLGLQSMDINKGD